MIWLRFESNQSGIETPTRRSPLELRERFESNQSGIETRWYVFVGFLRHGLNRTRVELKPLRSVRGTATVGCLNRTRVELKLDHSADHFSVSLSLNRTRVELKPEMFARLRVRSTV